MDAISPVVTDDTVSPAVGDTAAIPTVPKDWALEIMLDVLLGEDDENKETSFSLTVLSNGTIVSGLAISGEAWLDLNNNALRQGLGLDPEDATGGDEKPEPLSNANARRYFHMKDVIISQGGVPFEFSHWRGTLADVSGWTLGQVGPKK